MLSMHSKCALVQNCCVGSFDLNRTYSAAPLMATALILCSHDYRDFHYNADEGMTYHLGTQCEIVQLICRGSSQALKPVAVGWNPLYIIHV